MNDLMAAILKDVASGAVRRVVIEAVDDHPDGMEIRVECVRNGKLFVGERRLNDDDVALLRFPHDSVSAWYAQCLREIGTEGCPSKTA